MNWDLNKMANILQQKFLKWIFLFFFHALIHISLKLNC